MILMILTKNRFLCNQIGFYSAILGERQASPMDCRIATVAVSRCSTCRIPPCYSILRGGRAGHFLGVHGSWIPPGIAPEEHLSLHCFFPIRDDDCFIDTIFGKEILLITNVPASGYRTQWGIRPYLRIEMFAMRRKLRLYQESHGSFSL